MRADNMDYCTLKALSHNSKSFLNESSLILLYPYKRSISFLYHNIYFIFLKGSFTIINVTFCLLIADKVAPTHPPPSCLLFWCFVTLGVYLRVFTHGIPFIITCVYLDDSLDIFWLCILYKIIEKHTKLSYIFHFSSQNLQDYHIFFQFLLRIYPLLTINSIKLSVLMCFIHLQSKHWQKSFFS